MLAAKDGFQAGQTAKARLGPPCAVTPEKDMATTVNWNYLLIVPTPHPRRLLMYELGYEPLESARPRRAAPRRL